MRAKKTIFYILLNIKIACIYINICDKIHNEGWSVHKCFPPKGWNLAKDALV